MAVAPTTASGPSHIEGGPRKEPLVHPVNVSCCSSEICGAELKEPAYPSQQLRRPPVADDAEGSMTSSAQPSPSMEPPPPPAMERRRISLVKTASGRNIWWMDRGISSRRAEAMMRRRMKYLEEEAVRNAAAEEEVIGDQNEEERSCGQMGQLDVNNDTVVTSEPAFIDVTPEITSVETSNNDNKQTEERPDVSCGRALHEVSVEEEKSAAANMSANSGGTDICGEREMSHCDESYISVVHLSKSTNRAYLDFGEENTVGEPTSRSFLMQASDDSSGRGYLVLLDRCVPGRGIVCSEDSGMIEAYADENDALDRIQFTLREGESKMIYVSWNPSDAGCVRESIGVEVMDGDGIHWKQAVVIVGESLERYADETEQASDDQEYLIGEPGNVAESNMVSEITDSLEYSLGDLELGDSEDELLVGEEDCIVEEKKCEEDSSGGHGVEMSEKSRIVEEDGQPNITEDAHEENLWKGHMVSLELSDIEEVNGSDTQNEVNPNPQRNHVDSTSSFLGEPPQAMDAGIDLSASTIEYPALENSGASIPLAPIDEASSIDSESNEEQGLDEAADIPQHLEEPPQEDNGDVAGLVIEEFERKDAIPLNDAIDGGNAEDDLSNGVMLAMEEIEAKDAMPVKDATEGDNADPRPHAGVNDGKVVERQTSNESEAFLSADERQPEFDESQQLEEKENEQILTEGNRTRQREKLQTMKMNELENMLALEGLVAVEETREDLEMSNHGSPCSEESTDYDSPLVDVAKTKPLVDAHRLPFTELDQQHPRTPSLAECMARLQDLTPDSIDQDSSPEAANEADIHLVCDRLPLPRGDQRPQTPSLSECLASVEDSLLVSPDRESLQSPSGDLFLNYPSPEHADKNEESIVANMMNQASDVDSSPEKGFDSELRRTRYDLAGLIEDVSELEEVTQKQHTYITSPTNDDFHTQLDNINKDIDAITPPSAKLNRTSPKSGTNIVSVVDTVKGLRMKEASSVHLSSAAPERAAFAMSTPKKSARKCYFFKKPKSAGSTLERTRTDPPASSAKDNAKGQRKVSDTRISNTVTRPAKSDSLPTSSVAKKSAVLPGNAFKTPHRNRAEQPLTWKLSGESIEKEENGLTKRSSGTKKNHAPLVSSAKNTTVQPEDSFKTPHRNRSERIASIRNKLRVLTDPSSDLKAESNLVDNSRQVSTDPGRLTRPSAKTPKDPLTIDQLPDVTKTTAQRCYFYKSPRRNVKATRFSFPAADGTKPQSPNDAPVSSSEKGKQFDPKVDPMERLIFSPPVLGPREKRAFEKHINAIRDRKNNDSPSGATPGGPKRERNGSSPRMSTPSPRQMEAYEKHVRAMRERLSKDTPPKISPASLRKVKTNSAYDRHISRIRQGRKSLEEAN